MTITVKTNSQWRFLVNRHDVPAKVLADQFAHLDEDENLDGFFCYRGWWYHLSDFMRLDGVGFGEDLTGWQGYTSDSAFSGVIVKLSRDGDSVMCGTYFS